MPAKAGIQYPRASAIQSQALWNTGSPPIAVRRTASLRSPMAGTTSEDASGCLTIEEIHRRENAAASIRLPALRLDRVPDLGCDVRPAELGDGADAGRRGDVDLRQVAVDHVDADQQQAAFTQCGAEPLADL